MKQKNNYYNHLAVTNEEVEKVELRSEQVREILGSIPHWTIRSGSSYLLCLILMGLLISWFIKYPYKVKAPAVLTTEVPPVNIISQSAGYLVLWVKDKEKVKPGQYLGYLKNPAGANAVIDLIKEVDTLKTRFYQDPSCLDDYTLKEKSDLGELQDAYQLLVSSIRNYQFINRQKEYKKRQQALSMEISDYAALIRQQKEQTGIMSGELELSRQLFERDSILYAQKVISRAEFEQKQRDFLSSQRAHRNTSSEITNSEIQKTRLQGRIGELMLEEADQNKELLFSIEKAIREIDSRLKLWENVYLLKSPLAGIISLSTYWSNDQFIKSGEAILSVVPEKGNYLAKAKVQTTGSGKIKAGQKVNIKLNNYPYEEYGMVRGIIQNISLIPKENSYFITISLPAGLTTSYGNSIEFSQETDCQAEIITEDMRLLERFFYRYRKLIQ